MISQSAAYTYVTDRETVVLYPSFGQLIDGGRTWRVHISGAIYTPGVVNLQRRVLLRLLRRIMDVAPEALETDIFRERIGAFLSATSPGRRVTVRAGDLDFRLQKKSKRNGHFAGTLRLSAEHAAELANDQWIDFDVISADAEERRFGGQALLLPDTGVSVISDIDDTIKHSEVTSKRALLANTFLHEFQSIEGMAHLYRTWSEQGAAFHYISSSPWQLYLPLAALREGHGFPAGTFHLRAFRLRDHMLRRMLLIRRPGKGAVIRRMVANFPYRKFILIGDSAEKDPELYGAVARKYPERIQAIYIRDIPGSPLTTSRAARAFRRLPDDLWQIFQNSEEIPSNLETAMRFGLS